MQNQKICSFQLKHNTSDKTKNKVMNKLFVKKLNVAVDINKRSLTEKIAAALLNNIK